MNNALYAPASGSDLYYPPEIETPAPEAADLEPPVEAPEPVPVEQIIEMAVQRVMSVEEAVIDAPSEDSEVSRPFLSTPFSDYTVVEGLLLCIVLLLVLNKLWLILRRGFSWLR